MRSRADVGRGVPTRCIRRCRGLSFTRLPSAKTVWPCGLRWLLWTFWKVKIWASAPSKRVSICKRRLAESLHEFEMVKEVRGKGLLMGIEFQAPSHLRLRIPYQAFGSDSSRDVWPNRSDAPVPRLRISDANLRKQLSGAEGRTAAGCDRSAT